MTITRHFSTRICIIGFMTWKHTTTLPLWGEAIGHQWISLINGLDCGVCLLLRSLSRTSWRTNSRIPGVVWRYDAHVAPLWIFRCFSPITVTSQWAPWRLKLPASPLFTHLLIQAQIKENIKAPCHWPMCGGFTGHWCIPRTKGQWRGKCFHDVIMVYITLYVGKHCRLQGFYLPTEADLYIDRYCQGSTYRIKTLHLYFAMLDKFHRSRQQPGYRVLGYIAFTNVANHQKALAESH